MILRELIFFEPNKIQSTTLCFSPDEEKVKKVLKFMEENNML